MFTQPDRFFKGIHSSHIISGGKFKVNYNLKCAGSPAQDERKVKFIEALERYRNRDINSRLVDSDSKIAIRLSTTKNSVIIQLSRARKRLKPGSGSSPMEDNHPWGRAPWNFEDANGEEADAESDELKRIPEEILNDGNGEYDELSVGDECGRTTPPWDFSQDGGGNNSPDEYEEVEIIEEDWALFADAEWQDPDIAVSSPLSNKRRTKHRHHKEGWRIRTTEAEEGSRTHRGGRGGRSSSSPFCGENVICSSSPAEKKDPKRVPQYYFLPSRSKLGPATVAFRLMNAFLQIPVEEDINVMVTYKCPFNCIHCFAKDAREEGGFRDADKGSLKGTFEQLKGFSKAHLVGTGETTAYGKQQFFDKRGKVIDSDGVSKDFLDIVWHAAARVDELRIVTNAYLIPAGKKEARTFFAQFPDNIVWVVSANYFTFKEMRGKTRTSKSLITIIDTMEALAQKGMIRTAYNMRLREKTEHIINYALKFFHLTDKYRKDPENVFIHSIIMQSLNFAFRTHELDFEDVETHSTDPEIFFPFITQERDLVSADHTAYMPRKARMVTTLKESIIGNVNRSPLAYLFLDRLLFENFRDSIVRFLDIERGGSFCKGYIFYFELFEDELKSAIQGAYLYTLGYKDEAKSLLFQRSPVTKEIIEMLQYKGFLRDMVAAYGLNASSPLAEKSSINTFAHRLRKICEPLGVVLEKKDIDYYYGLQQAMNKLGGNRKFPFNITDYFEFLSTDYDGTQEPAYLRQLLYLRRVHKFCPFSLYIGGFSSWVDSKRRLLFTLQHGQELILLRKWQIYWLRVFTVDGEEIGWLGFKTRPKAIHHNISRKKVPYSDITIRFLKQTRLYNGKQILNRQFRRLVFILPTITQPFGVPSIARGIHLGQALWAIHMVLAQMLLFESVNSGNGIVHTWLTSRQSRPLKRKFKSTGPLNISRRDWINYIELLPQPRQGKHRSAGSSSPVLFEQGRSSPEEDGKILSRVPKSYTLTATVFDFHMRPRSNIVALAKNSEFQRNLTITITYKEKQARADSIVEVTLLNIPERVKVACAVTIHIEAKSETGEAKRTLLIAALLFKQLFEHALSKGNYYDFIDAKETFINNHRDTPLGKIIEILGINLSPESSSPAHTQLPLSKADHPGIYLWTLREAGSLKQKVVEKKGRLGKNTLCEIELCYQNVSRAKIIKTLKGIFKSFINDLEEQLGIPSELLRERVFAAAGIDFSFMELMQQIKKGNFALDKVMDKTSDYATKMQQLRNVVENSTLICQLKSEVKVIQQTQSDIVMPWIAPRRLIQKAGVVAIPKIMRDEMGIVIPSIVCLRPTNSLARGTNCIRLYTQARWAQMVSDLEKAVGISLSKRDIERYFGPSAWKTKVYQNGSMVIPRCLINRVGLAGANEVIFVYDPKEPIFLRIMSRENSEVFIGKIRHRQWVDKQGCVLDKRTLSSPAGEGCPRGEHCSFLSGTFVGGKKDGFFSFIEGNLKTRENIHSSQQDGNFFDECPSEAYFKPVFANPNIGSLQDIGDSTSRNTSNLVDFIRRILSKTKRFTQTKGNHCDISPRINIHWGFNLFAVNLKTHSGNWSRNLSPIGRWLTLVFKTNHFSLIKTSSPGSGILATKGVLWGYFLLTILSIFSMSKPVAIAFPSMITTYWLMSLLLLSLIYACKFLFISFSPETKYNTVLMLSQQANTTEYISSSSPLAAEWPPSMDVISPILPNDIEGCKVVFLPEEYQQQRYDGVHWGADFRFCQLYVNDEIVRLRPGTPVRTIQSGEIILICKDTIPYTHFVVVAYTAVKSHYDPHLPCEKSHLHYSEILCSKIEIETLRSFRHGNEEFKFKIFKQQFNQACQRGNIINPEVRFAFLPKRPRGSYGLEGASSPNSSEFGKASPKAGSPAENLHFPGLIPGYLRPLGKAIEESKTTLAEWYNQEIDAESYAMWEAELNRQLRDWGDLVNALSLAKMAKELTDAHMQYLREFSEEFVRLNDAILDLFREKDSVRKITIQNLYLKLWNAYLRLVITIFEDEDLAKKVYERIKDHIDQADTADYKSLAYVKKKFGTSSPAKPLSKKAKAHIQCEANKTFLSVVGYVDRPDVRSNFAIRDTDDLYIFIKGLQEIEKFARKEGHDSNSVIFEFKNKFFALLLVGHIFYNTLMIFRNESILKLHGEEIDRYKLIAILAMHMVLPDEEEILNRMYKAFHVEGYEEVEIREILAICNAVRNSYFLQQKEDDNPNRRFSSPVKKTKEIVVSIVVLIAKAPLFLFKKVLWPFNFHAECHVRYIKSLRELLKEIEKSEEERNDSTHKDESGKASSPVQADKAAMQQRLLKIFAEYREKKTALPAQEGPDEALRKKLLTDKDALLSHIENINRQLIREKDKEGFKTLAMRREVLLERLTWFYFGDQEFERSIELLSLYLLPLEEQLLRITQTLGGDKLKKKKLKDLIAIKTKHLGEIGHSLDVSRERLTLRRLYARAYYFRGITYAVKDDMRAAETFRKAREILDSMVKGLQDNYEYYTELLEWSTMMKQFTDAHQHATNAQEYNPVGHRLQINLGDLSKGQKDEVEAIAHYKMAAEYLTTRDQSNMEEMQKTQEALNAQPKSPELILRMLQLENEQLRLSYGYAKLAPILYEANDCRQALHCYHRLAVIQGVTDVYLNVAKLHNRLGEPDKALAILLQVRDGAKEPSQVLDACFHIFDLCFTYDLWDEAQAEMNQILSQPPMRERNIFVEAMITSIMERITRDGQADLTRFFVILLSREDIFDRDRICTYFIFAHERLRLASLSEQGGAQPQQAHFGRFIAMLEALAKNAGASACAACIILEGIGQPCQPVSQAEGAPQDLPELTKAPEQRSARREYFDAICGQLEKVRTSTEPLETIRNKVALGAAFAGAGYEERLIALWEEIYADILQVEKRSNLSPQDRGQLLSNRIYILISLGVFLFAMDKREAALEKIKQAERLLIDEREKTAEIMGLSLWFERYLFYVDFRAKIYEDLGEIDKAKELLMKAIANLSKAMEDKKELVALKSYLHTLCVHVAKIHHNQQDRADCLRLLYKARKFGEDAESVTALYWSGVCALERNHFESGLHYFRLALVTLDTAAQAGQQKDENEAYRAPCLYGLGEVLCRLNRFKEAAEYWQQALSLPSVQDAHLLCLVVQRLFDMNRSRDAFYLLQQAATSSSGDRDVYMLIIKYAHTQDGRDYLRRLFSANQHCSWIAGTLKNISQRLTSREAEPVATFHQAVREAAGESDLARVNVEAFFNLDGDKLVAAIDANLGLLKVIDVKGTEPAPAKPEEKALKEDVSRKFPEEEGADIRERLIAIFEEHRNNREQGIRRYKETKKKNDAIVQAIDVAHDSMNKEKKTSPAYLKLFFKSKKYVTELLTRLLEMGEFNDFLHNLGNLEIYLKEIKRKNAEEHREMLRLDRHFANYTRAQMHLRLGMLHKQSNEPQEAIKQLQKARDLYNDLRDKTTEGSNPIIELDLAEAYIELGDVESALPILQRAARGEFRTFVLEGKLHIAQNRIDDAEKYLREAHALLPKEGREREDAKSIPIHQRVEMLETLGRVCLLQGKEEDSLKMNLEALAYAPYALGARDSVFGICVKYSLLTQAQEELEEIKWLSGYRYLLIVERMISRIIRQTKEHQAGFVKSLFETLFAVEDIAFMDIICDACVENYHDSEPEDVAHIVPILQELSRGVDEEESTQGAKGSSPIKDSSRRSIAHTARIILEQLEQPATFKRPESDFAKDFAKLFDVLKSAPQVPSAREKTFQQIREQERKIQNMIKEGKGSFSLVVLEEKLCLALDYPNVGLLGKALELFEEMYNYMDESKKDGSFTYREVQIPIVCLRNLGRLYYRMGKNELAEEKTREGISLLWEAEKYMKDKILWLKYFTPSLKTAVYVYGELRKFDEVKQQLVRALDFVNELIKDEDDFFLVRQRNYYNFLLGICLEEENDYDAAFNQVSKIKGYEELDCAEVLYLLGVVCLDMRSIFSAQHYFALGYNKIRLHPMSKVWEVKDEEGYQAACLYGLVEIYLRLGQLKDAHDALKNAVPEKELKDTTTLICVVQTLFEYGQDALAFELLKRGILLYPTSNNLYKLAIEQCHRKLAVDFFGQLFSHEDSALLSLNLRQTVSLMLSGIDIKEESREKVATFNTMLEQVREFSPLVAKVVPIFAQKDLDGDTMVTNIDGLFTDKSVVLYRLQNTLDRLMQGDPSVDLNQLFRCIDEAKKHPDKDTIKFLEGLRKNVKGKYAKRILQRLNDTIAILKKAVAAQEAGAAALKRQADLSNIVDTLNKELETIAQEAAAIEKNVTNTNTREGLDELRRRLLSQQRELSNLKKNYSKEIKMAATSVALKAAEQALESARVAIDKKVQIIGEANNTLNRITKRAREIQQEAVRASIEKELTDLQKELKAMRIQLEELTSTNSDIAQGIVEARQKAEQALSDAEKALNEKLQGIENTRAAYRNIASRAGKLGDVADEKKLQSDEETLANLHKEIEELDVSYKSILKEMTSERQQALDALKIAKERIHTHRRSLNLDARYLAIVTAAKDLGNSDDENQLSADEKRLKELEAQLKQIDELSMKNGTGNSSPLVQKQAWDAIKAAREKIKQQRIKNVTRRCETVVKKADSLGNTDEADKLGADDKTVLDLETEIAQIKQYCFDHNIAADTDSVRGSAKRAVDDARIKIKQQKIKNTNNKYQKIFEQAENLGTSDEVGLLQSNEKTVAALQKEIGQLAQYCQDNNIVNETVSAGKQAENTLDSADKRIQKKKKIIDVKEQCERIVNIVKGPGMSDYDKQLKADNLTLSAQEEKLRETDGFCKHKDNNIEQETASSREQAQSEIVAARIKIQKKKEIESLKQKGYSMKTIQSALAYVGDIKCNFEVVERVAWIYHNKPFLFEIFDKTDKNTIIEQLSVLDASVQEAEAVSELYPLAIKKLIIRFPEFFVISDLGRYLGSEEVRGLHWSLDMFKAFLTKEMVENGDFDNRIAVVVEGRVAYAFVGKDVSREQTADVRLPDTVDVIVRDDSKAVRDINICYGINSQAVISQDPVFDKKLQALSSQRLTGSIDRRIPQLRIIQRGQIDRAIYVSFSSSKIYIFVGKNVSGSEMKDKLEYIERAIPWGDYDVGENFIIRWRLYEEMAEETNANTAHTNQLLWDFAEKFVGFKHTSQSNEARLRGALETQPSILAIGDVSKRGSIIQQLIDLVIESVKMRKIQIGNRLSPLRLAIRFFKGFVETITDKMLLGNLFREIWGFAFCRGMKGSQEFEVRQKLISIEHSDCIPIFRKKLGDIKNGERYSSLAEMNYPELANLIIEVIERGRWYPILSGNHRKDTRRIYHLESQATDKACILTLGLRGEIEAMTEVKKIDAIQRVVQEFLRYDISDFKGIIEILLGRSAQIRNAMESITGDDVDNQALRRAYEILASQDSDVRGIFYSIKDDHFLKVTYNGEFAFLDYRGNIGMDIDESGAVVRYPGVVEERVRSDVFVDITYLTQRIYELFSPGP